MPISLVLNEEQNGVFSQAAKAAKLEVSSNRGTITLTRENWEQVRAAVKALHEKKYSVKTKTVEHLEVCYYAQEILNKIDGVAGEFSAPVASNDDTVGIIGNISEEEVETFFNPPESTDNDSND